MSSTYSNFSNLDCETLIVETTLTAPSQNLAEILVSDGINIAYQTVGVDTYLLQADSNSITGISYVEPSGGSGGSDVQMLVSGSLDINSSTNVQYIQFNPWSDETIDAFALPFNLSLNYIQVYTLGSENWAFGAATNIEFNVGKLDSSGVFVLFSGTPHVSLDSATYNVTGNIFQSDVSGNSWTYSAGENYAVGVQWIGGLGTNMRIGVLATFVGSFS